MSAWQIVLLVIVVLFTYLEIKNRRERPYYEKLERENAALLEGRFQGSPVLRRRFMRALMRYCISDGYSNLAFQLAQNAAKMAKNPEDRAACALLMAFNLEEAGNYAEAIDLYDKVLYVEPDNMIALQRKAKALGEIREEDCVEVFEEVIRRAPDDYAYRNNYGKALLYIGRYDEAIAQLNKAIEIDDRRSSAYGWLVAAYTLMEDHDAKESAIAAAVARGADESELRASCKTILEILKSE